MFNMVNYKKKNMGDNGTESNCLGISISGGVVNRLEVISDRLLETEGVYSQ